jgi:alanine racemase
LNSNDIVIPGDAGASLVIDLGAIAGNYQLLQQTCPGAEVGASVKANAYGLGLAEVATTLSTAGCHIFFVATPQEGRELRGILPTAEIVVLNGPEREATEIYATDNLCPTLNSLDQIDAWREGGGQSADAPSAYLHIDTGMNRLGLGPEEVSQLLAAPERLHDVSVTTILSHLACGDTPDHPMNAAQLASFIESRRRIEALTGPIRGSLANSPGAFLGRDYHLDIVRPGAALYGVTPNFNKPNPMAQTVEIYAKILQVRDVDTPMTVGYGAAHRVAKPTRIATVAAGYADGYPRAAANDADTNMQAHIGGHNVPLFGRVSMDLITLDVSALPADLAVPGQVVELLGPHISLDDLAVASGTIGYEVLARLGNRLHRTYKQDQA